MVCRQIQYTEDETKAVRIVTNEVHVYDPSNFAAGIADKLRIEGITSVCVSPGKNPSLGLFVAEKKVNLSRSNCALNLAHSNFQL